VTKKKTEGGQFIRDEMGECRRSHGRDSGAGDSREVQPRSRRRRNSRAITISNFGSKAMDQLYVRVDKGLKARSGYELAEEHANIVEPAELPQEIEIQAMAVARARRGAQVLSIRCAASR